MSFKKSILTTGLIITTLLSLNGCKTINNKMVEDMQIRKAQSLVMPIPDFQNLTGQVISKMLMDKALFSQKHGRHFKVALSNVTLQQTNSPDLTNVTIKRLLNDKLESSSRFNVVAMDQRPEYILDVSLIQKNEEKPKRSITTYTLMVHVHKQKNGWSNSYKASRYYAFVK